MTTGGGFGGDLKVAAKESIRPIEFGMPIFQTFSKRMRQQRGEFPQVFQTEKMSNELKAHIRRIFYNLVGELHADNWAHEIIGGAMATEYPHMFSDRMQPVYIPASILGKLEHDDFLFLDLIEMAVKIRTNLKNENDNGLVPPSGSVGLYIQLSFSLKDALDDLNYRFRECGYGYQIENVELVPIDSTFTHSQSVEPALSLLKSEEFSSSLDEFYSAFEDYKRGDYRDSIKKCGDAIDSTMKTIFSRLSWNPPSSGNFAPYVREALKNGLLPEHLETYFNHLAGIIISGAGNLRNKEGGHGKGPDEVEAPDYFARYMINMTASTILLLIHAYQDKVATTRQG